MRQFTSWFRICYGFVIMSIAAAVLMPVCVLLLPWRKARIKVGNLYGKVIGYIIAKVARANVVIHNRERLNAAFPAIYASNHASIVDIFIGMWLCPYGGCGIAKREVARVPFFGWLYWLTGHLLIDRSNRDNAIAALQKVSEDVRKYKMGIWIWPEGTRSRSGRLQPFKKGIGHLAIATGLPIVPVVVHNAHRNWEKHKFMLNPVTVDVEVLPTVSTEGWTLENLDAHLQELHDLMAATLGPEQRPLPSPEQP